MLVFLSFCLQSSCKNTQTWSRPDRNLQLELILSKWILPFLFCLETEELQTRRHKYSRRKTFVSFYQLFITPVSRLLNASPVFMRGCFLVSPSLRETVSVTVGRGLHLSKGPSRNWTCSAARTLLPVPCTFHSIVFLSQEKTKFQRLEASSPAGIETTSGSADYGGSSLPLYAPLGGGSGRASK